MNTATLAKSLILVIIMTGIGGVYLFMGFAGLTSPEGMEKAQLGREISRGAFKTKSIKPLSIGQFTAKHKRAPKLHEVTRADTFHAPLYPMVLGAVFKVVDAGNYEKWKMSETDKVYGLDRIVVGVNMLFFMMSAILAYFMARRLFDSSIATITFLIVICTDLFWKFTFAGSPNSLMLLLFMAAMYFTYLATEKSLEQRKISFFLGILAGGCLILLSLTHWMGLWLLAGYLIYAFFFIRPLGVVSAVVILASGLAFAYPALQNYKMTGNPFGTAFYTIYAGLGYTEEVVFRSGNANEILFNAKTIILNFLSNLMTGFIRVFEYSGAVFAAPVFFLSCLHTFNNPVVARFRWAVLIIWAFGATGMAIYGYGEDAFFSRQLHFLFVPVMVAYGMAMLAVIWAKSDLFKTGWSSGYLWIIGAISIFPMLFNIPQIAIDSLSKKSSSNTWPLTSAVVLNRSLNYAVPANQYIFSDQPWAVSWYADRYAIWTPYKYNALLEIENNAKAQGLPIAGILVTPETAGLDSLFESNAKSNSLFLLGVDQWSFMSSEGRVPFGSVFRGSPDSLDLFKKYPNPNFLYGSLMTYYSAEKVDLSLLKEE